MGCTSSPAKDLHICGEKRKLLPGVTPPQNLTSSSCVAQQSSSALLSNPLKFSKAGPASRHPWHFACKSTHFALPLHTKSETQVQPDQTHLFLFPFLRYSPLHLLLSHVRNKADFTYLQRKAITIPVFWLSLGPALVKHFFSIEVRTAASNRHFNSGLFYSAVSHYCSWYTYKADHTHTHLFICTQKYVNKLRL